MQLPRILMPGVVAALLATLLTGCDTLPTGPSVAVMPAAGKPLDLFQQEDQQCRAYADQSLGPNAQYAGNQALVGSAVVGTAVGAVIGGAMGGARGAAGGAGMGLAAGTVVGAGQAQNTGYSLQQRYDIAYQQCMYSKGNQVAPQRVRVYRSYGPPPPGYYYYGP